MHRLKSILVLFIVISLAGCDLLGDQNPQQSLPTKGGLNSVSDLQKALTGAYDDLQANTAGESFGETIFGADIIADDAVFTGSFPTFQQIGNQKMAPNNGSITSMWNGAYRNINDANIILSRLDELGSDLDAPQATLDNIKGQALFIRAVQYYYLADLFALPASATPDESQMGVPIQLKAVTSSADFAKPARSPLDSVYIQINSDLEKAEGLLSPDNARNRARPAAATGLMARIALVRGDNEKAADLSGEVLDNSAYSLESDVKTYFVDELSSESIFEIQNTPQDIPDGANTAITALYNIDSRDDIQINITFANALNEVLNSRQKSEINSSGATAVDTRKSELIVGKDDDGNIYTHKSRSGYSTGDSNSDKYESSKNSDDNIPILRLSEMILTRAEALARLNGIQKEPIDLVNEIRERAFSVEGGDVSLVDYEKSDFSSKQDLIDAILLERRVELAFEGHRKTDLQRTKQDVRGLPYDSPKLVYPIPQSQLDSNDNIDQNEGYGG